MQHIKSGRAFGALGVAALLGACTPPYPASNPYPFGPQPTYGAGYAAPGNLAQESADRVERFRRLSALGGIAAPVITQNYAPPGSVPGIPGPVPVVRVVFEERAFFDTASALPRPEAATILDIVAENMRRDVPDTQLTLLGHTDAIGSDAYNDDLSLRRAQAVLQALAARRTNPAQLSTVAIGKHQPIAPNTTAEGRARNRRVEFLISASFDANLAVVRDAASPAAWLTNDAGRQTPPSGPVRVSIFRPAPAGSAFSGPTDGLEAPLVLQRMGEVELQPPGPGPFATEAAGPGTGFAAPPPPNRNSPATQAAPTVTRPRQPQRVSIPAPRMPELNHAAPVERAKLDDEKTTY